MQIPMVILVSSSSSCTKFITHFADDAPPLTLACGILEVLDQCKVLIQQRRQTLSFSAERDQKFGTLLEHSDGSKH